MEINNIIIKHYLKNVMFINGTPYAGKSTMVHTHTHTNGTPYAGKSTMVRMLADRYGLVHCGENYDCVPESIRTPDKFPGLCYFQTMKDWQEFVNRPPDEYAKWLYDTSREIEQFEIAYLMQKSGNQKIIVDTNISADVLHEITDYNQVAIMLCPQSMSVEKFFERDDKGKVFMKERIAEAENPQKTMESFLAGIAKYSQDIFDEFYDAGFFTLLREDTETDTKEETLEILAKHFGLID